MKEKAPRIVLPLVFASAYAKQQRVEQGRRRGEARQNLKSGSDTNAFFSASPQPVEIERK